MRLCCLFSNSPNSARKSRLLRMLGLCIGVSPSLAFAERYSYPPEPLHIHFKAALRTPVSKLLTAVPILLLLNHAHGCRPGGHVGRCFFERNRNRQRSRQGGRQSAVVIDLDLEPLANGRPATLCFLIDDIRSCARHTSTHTHLDRSLPGQLAHCSFQIISSFWFRSLLPLHPLSASARSFSRQLDLPRYHRRRPSCPYHHC
jgi:hypothetical protein